MKLHSFLLLIISILLLTFSPIQAQRTVNITIVSDNAIDSDHWFEKSVKLEIIALLQSRYNVVIKERYCAFKASTIDNNLNQLFSDNETDIIIASGALSCNQLANRNSYPKPAIAGLVIDNELQNVPITSDNTSGVNNFTYIKSLFDVQRDLAKLYDIKPYRKVGIIADEVLKQNILNFDAIFHKFTEQVGAAFEFVTVNSNIDYTLEKITPDIEAVYVLPLFQNFTNAEIARLLDGIAEKKLPAFALLSHPMIDLGAFAAYESTDNLQKVPRRIAINVMKILEGQNAADLPVIVPTFNENLVINMKTANKAGVYPNWDILSASTLINVHEVETDRMVSLKSAIAEALENNLTYKIAKKETRIVAKDVSIAQSELLPQIDASTAGILIDKNRADNSFGMQGRVTWTAGGDLTQLILSEPAIANIAIQKLLLKSQQRSEYQAELDVVLEVSQAYLGLLQAQTFVQLQNDNVNVTRKNYDISLAKEAVGYSGTTDVYRWKSQLALNNIDLNNAQAQLQQARFNLNQLLNRPINEPFKTSDAALEDSVLLVTDYRMLQLVDNPGELEKFSDFMVTEAFRNLPEIHQVDAAIAAQERLYLSQKRAYFTPTIAVTGELDYVIDQWGLNLPPATPEIATKPTWNTALAVQIPIFQGMKRRHQQQQTKITILQLQDELAKLRNLLEFQVRANMESAGASFGNLDLSQEAAEAAQKNFEIAQDSYKQGLVNVTTLIDAQNAALQAEVNATNAIYQFMLDFLAVERSIGGYYFLATKEQQQAFFERYFDFYANGQ